MWHNASKVCTCKSYRQTYIYIICIPKKHFGKTSLDTRQCRRLPTICSFIEFIFIHIHMICVRNHSWFCTCFFSCFFYFDRLLVFYCFQSVISCEYPLTCITCVIHLYDYEYRHGLKALRADHKTLYLKNSDIQCKDKSRITDFDLMEIVTAVVEIPYIAYNM